MAQKTPANNEQGTNPKRWHQIDDSSHDTGLKLSTFFFRLPTLYSFHVNACFKVSLMPFGLIWCGSHILAVTPQILT